MEDRYLLSKTFISIIFFLLVSLILVSCVGRSDVHVSGVDFDYIFPEKYINNHGVNLYGSEFVGDKSRTISLIIPKDEGIKLDDIVDSEVSILIFADKKYSPKKSLFSFAKKIVKDSRYLQYAKPYFEYVNETKVGVTHYFLTFDPNAENDIHISEKDYVVRIQYFENIEIGGVKKRSRPLCIMHSVFDGLALQFSLSGNACQRQYLDNLKSYQDSLFKNWARSRTVDQRSEVDQDIHKP